MRFQQEELIQRKFTSTFLKWFVISNTCMLRPLLCITLTRRRQLVESMVNDDAEQSRVGRCCSTSPLHVIIYTPVTKIKNHEQKKNRSSETVLAEEISLQV